MGCGCGGVDHDCLPNNFGDCPPAGFEMACVSCFISSDVRQANDDRLAQQLLIDNLIVPGATFTGQMGTTFSLAFEAFNSSTGIAGLPLSGTFFIYCSVGGGPNQLVFQSNNISWSQTNINQIAALGLTAKFIQLIGDAPAFRMVFSSLQPGSTNAVNAFFGQAWSTNLFSSAALPVVEDSGNWGQLSFPSFPIGDLKFSLWFAFDNIQNVISIAGVDAATALVFAR